MKKLSIIFLFIISIFFFTSCSEMIVSGKPDLSVDMQPRKISIENTKSISEVVKTISPAVVGISASNGYSTSVGSGVAISNGGYILTNQHVVDGAKDIVVYFANKTSARATFVWEDSSVDIAVIKATVNIPYLETESLSEVEVGEDVLAVGTPIDLQFKHTVTKGIVSALQRTIEMQNVDGTYSYLQNLIQHDASINPGNSGGPLISIDGRVIGINTLKVTEAEGIGFAIPIDVAKNVVNKISETGRYVTPYIGVYGFDADIAGFSGRTLEKKGVYLLNVEKEGPAGKAGLKVDDVITKINNYNISTMLDLRTVIYNFEIGETVKVTYIRNGVEQTIDLTLSER